MIASLQNSKVKLAALKVPISCRFVKRMYNSNHAFYDDSIEKHALKSLAPVTLSELLRIAEKPVTSEKLLSSAKYAHRELPVRLARRIRSMQQLPYIVGLNPYIRQIYILYHDSFEKLRSFPSIDSLQQEEEFTELLSDLVSSHSNVISGLAHGIKECHKYMSEEQVTKFLDSMIQARIGIRVIAENHIALHEDLPNYSGIVNHRLIPARVIEKCGQLAQTLCEVNFGDYPEFLVDGHTDVGFPYIDVHLEYMIFELLKNSFRASVEHSKNLHKRKHRYPVADVPAVQITIAKGQEDVTFRIRDQGGGIPKHRLSKVWNYSFTTADDDDDELDNGVLSSASKLGVITGTGGPIAGLGYGLPMTKIYAEWAGGSLQLRSIEDYGTDVFLRLPFIRNVECLKV